MPHVKISVFERKGLNETLVESRFVEIGTERRLTGAIVRRVLSREFPELGYIGLLSKTDRGWAARRTVRPVGGCDYHYIWQYYYVTAA
jgi:hypothetical protein